MKKISIFIFLILILSNYVKILKADIIKYHLPEITNYPQSINVGQTQTWWITQGDDGKWKLATIDGLLM